MTPFVERVCWKCKKEILEDGVTMYEGKKFCECKKNLK